MRIPFFHYTYLDNLPSILKNARLISRKGLMEKGTKFIDVSIDPEQPVRRARGLLNYIPLFAGFYKKFMRYELNGYLSKKYDNPRVQNKSFYGTLNKTLQIEMGKSYENIIILLVDNELVYEFADQDKVRFFTDIAIKNDSVEMPVRNRADLKNCLKNGINGENISGEIDLFDDGRVSIECTSDIEAIIVDNNRIRTKVVDFVTKYDTTGTAPLTLVSELPRDAIPSMKSWRTPTDKQLAFAKYVEDLKQKGVTGEKYREKIVQWQREHKES